MTHYVFGDKMVTIVEIIYGIIQLIYRETGVKPTKLFLGYTFLQTLNQEIMDENRCMGEFLQRGRTFMDLEIVTKDQFGIEFPSTYLGVV